MLQSQLRIEYNIELLFLYLIKLALRILFHSFCHPSGRFIFSLILKPSFHFSCWSYKLSGCVPSQHLPFSNHLSRPYPSKPSLVIRGRSVFRDSESVFLVSANRCLSRNHSCYQNETETDVATHINSLDLVLAMPCLVFYAMIIREAMWGIT